jgi:hypothetical protein
VDRLPLTRLRSSAAASCLDSVARYDRRDMTDTRAKHPDHPASQSDDGSYRGDEHGMLDGPDGHREGQHDDHHRPSVKEVLTDPPIDRDGFEHTADHSHVYHNMMRVGFTLGLPIGTGIAMFVTLLLLGENILVAVFLAFLTWLGVLGFSKAFFVHAGAEGEEH